MITVILKFKFIDGGLIMLLCTCWTWTAVVWLHLDTTAVATQP